MKSKNTKYLIITGILIGSVLLGGYIWNHNKKNNNNSKINDENKSIVTKNEDDKKKTNVIKESDKKDIDKKEEDKKVEDKKVEDKKETEKKVEDKSKNNSSEETEITEEKAIRLINKVVVPTLGPRIQNAKLDIKCNGVDTINGEKCYVLSISYKERDKVKNVSPHAVAVNGKTIYYLNNKTNTYEKFTNKY